MLGLSLRLLAAWALLNMRDAVYDSIPMGMTLFLAYMHIIQLYKLTLRTRFIQGPFPT